MTKFKRKSKEERKIEIRNAAISIFAEKGYRNTTMEDVIKKTSLSKGGVYRYYKNTKDIMIDIMRLGNDYRMNIFKELSEQIDDDLSINDKIIRMIKNKIFDKKPFIKLYLMFISEIIYDSEIRKLFYQIEKEAIDKVLEFEREYLNQKKSNLSSEKLIFMSRIINALIFIDELFKEQNIFENNKDIVERMIKTIFE